MSEYNEDDFDGLEPEEQVRLLLAAKDVCKMLATDSGSFVCTDIDGAQHDLSPPGSCYYITSKPEGPLHRIHAGYWPDELAEGGIEGCRQSRGYNPIDFLVDDREHARMLRDGVLDVVGGQNVLEALCDRVDALSRGQREN
jgi:hypothetical protein